MNAWNIFCILIRQILFKIRTHELAENQELFTVASCGLVIRYLIGILSCSMMVLHCTMKYSIDCIKWKVTILFCGKIVAIVVDAYTNSKLQWLPLIHAVQGFFFLLKLVVWWTSMKRYHGFHALAKKRFSSCFLSTRRKMSAFKQFCNILL